MGRVAPGVRLLAVATARRGWYPVATLATQTIDLSPMFRGLWPVYVVAALVIIARAAPEFWRLYRRRRAGMLEVDRMSGREFEHYLGLLFTRLGYRVDVTKAHGDFGADLVVRRGDRRILVQAKRWQKSVGIKAVQEAAAAVAYYKVDAAMVVANRSFTRAARQLAKANRVDLWDRDALAAKIIDARLGPNAAVQIAPPAELPGDSAATPPMCQRCGSPMVLRTGPRGDFYGCSTFPRCRYTAAGPTALSVPGDLGGPSDR